MKLNIVGFTIEHHKSYEGFEYSTININIDGLPLAGIMKDVELPISKQQNETVTAGNYGSIYLPSSLIGYFLGESEADEGSSEDKTTLLECTCGCTGCWPLLCNIKETDNIITWKNFEQPHRAIDSHIYWDYSKFKGFFFDKEQYLKALQQTVPFNN